MSISVATNVRQTPRELIRVRGDMINASVYLEPGGEIGPGGVVDIFGHQ
jgi:hypothetical protein